MLVKMKQGMLKKGIHMMKMLREPPKTVRKKRSTVKKRVARKRMLKPLV